MPCVAMPRRPDPAWSTKLKGVFPSASPSAGLRASIFWWFKKDVRGKMTQRCVSLTKPCAGLTRRSSWTRTVAQP